MRGRHLRRHARRSVYVRSKFPEVRLHPTFGRQIGSKFPILHDNCVLLVSGMLGARPIRCQQPALALNLKP
jgi:hypothetical protein